MNGAVRDMIQPKTGIQALLEVVKVQNVEQPCRALYVFVPLDRDRFP